MIDKLTMHAVEGNEIIILCTELSESLSDAQFTEVQMLIANVSCQMSSSSIALYGEENS